MDYKYYVHVNCGAEALYRVLSNPATHITPFSSFPALHIEVFKENLDNNIQGHIPMFEMGTTSRYSNLDMGTMKSLWV